MKNTPGMNALFAWAHSSPWVRCDAGDGLSLTDDVPWGCDGCSQIVPNEGHTPTAKDGTHDEGCRWVAMRELLTDYRDLEQKVGKLVATILRVEKVVDDGQLTLDGTEVIIAALRGTSTDPS
jgi:hypothetical protein